MCSSSMTRFVGFGWRSGIYITTWDTDTVDNMVHSSMRCLWCDYENSWQQHCHFEPFISPILLKHGPSSDTQICLFALRPLASLRSFFAGCLLPLWLWRCWFPLSPDAPPPFCNQQPFLDFNHHLSGAAAVPSPVPVTAFSRCLGLCVLTTASLADSVEPIRRRGHTRHSPKWQINALSITAIFFHEGGQCRILDFSYCGQAKYQKWRVLKENSKTYQSEMFLFFF